MNDLTHGLDHGLGRFRLENVSSHVHTQRAFFGRAPRHLQSLEFRQLFASGNYDWNRAGGRNRFEALRYIVGLHVGRAQLRANTAGQSHVARIALQFAANGRDRQNRHTVFLAGVNQTRQIVHGLAFVFSSNEDLNGHRGGVQADHILHVHCDLLVRQFL